MERHSKIINFSLPPGLYNELDKLAEASQRSRSEMLRAIITSFLSRSRELSSEQKSMETASLPEIISAYWKARSSWPLDVVIAGLVIATNDKGEVLIGKRLSSDPHVPNLTWSFIGSKLQSLDFLPELVQSLHERTGLHVELNQVVAARVVPESGQSGTQVVALYVHGQVQGQQNFVAHDPYTELKWVKPLEVFRYFTSSTTDEVTAFLNSLKS